MDRRNRGLARPLVWFGYDSPRHHGTADSAGAFSCVSRAIRWVSMRFQSGRLKQTLIEGGRLRRPGELARHMSSSTVQTRPTKASNNLLSTEVTFCRTSEPELRPNRESALSGSICTGLRELLSLGVPEDENLRYRGVTTDNNGRFFACLNDGNAEECASCAHTGIYDFWSLCPRSPPAWPTTLTVSSAIYYPPPQSPFTSGKPRFLAECLSAEEAALAW